MAAIGWGGRKAEADVSYDPAHGWTPGAEDTTNGAQPNPDFEGPPAGDLDTEKPRDADGATPAQQPAGHDVGAVKAVTICRSTATNELGRTTT